MNEKFKMALKSLSSKNSVLAILFINDSGCISESRLKEELLVSRIELIDICSKLKAFGLINKYMDEKGMSCYCCNEKMYDFDRVLKECEKCGVEHNVKCENIMCSKMNDFNRYKLIKAIKQNCSEVSEISYYNKNAKKSILHENLLRYLVSCYQDRFSTRYNCNQERVKQIIKQMIFLVKSIDKTTDIQFEVKKKIEKVMSSFKTENQFTLKRFIDIKNYLNYDSKDKLNKKTEANYCNIYEIYCSYMKDQCQLLKEGMTCTKEIRKYMREKNEC